ncbi:hypothetical protein CSKR_112114 [Clonorchis sinensis]|uniref:Uncharacterized protein n=1 Tax=Clonorchis sinensis TaxID=79923 RepID=A0A8T1MHS6_CLOSI|nr:hypothetical protein CSKR_112114 [Clonorchis sinensis]
MEDFDEPSGEPHYEEIGDNAIYAVAAVTGYKKIDYAQAYAKKERKTITVIETTTYFQRRIEHDRLYRERLRRRLEMRLKKSIEHAKMGRHVYNTSVLVHKSSQQPYIAVRVQVIMHSPNGNTSKLLRRKRAIKPITVEEQNANYFNVMMCPGLYISFAVLEYELWKLDILTEGVATSPTAHAGHNLSPLSTMTKSIQAALCSHRWTTTDVVKMAGRKLIMKVLC